MSRRFVMLDRDGTLIHERHYLSDPAQVELLPGVVEGLQLLRSMGLGLVVLTNQSGIARGFFSLATLNKVHERMTRLLGEEGLTLDGIYTCPHLPEDKCDCRKPATGMAIDAAQQLNFNPAEAFMVGDKAIDMLLGKDVGATTILVLTGYGKDEREASAGYSDYVAEDLPCVAQIIASLVESPDRSDYA